MFRTQGAARTGNRQVIDGHLGEVGVNGAAVFPPADDVAGLLGRRAEVVFELVVNEVAGRSVKLVENVKNVL